MEWGVEGVRNDYKQKYDKREEYENIKKDGQCKIEQVTEFQYLGTIIEKNWTQEKEINKLIEKSGYYHGMCKSFTKKRKLSRET